MTYILIVFSLSYGQRVSFQEFGDVESCRAAAVVIQKMNQSNLRIPDETLRMSCVQKAKP